MASSFFTKSRLQRAEEAKQREARKRAVIEENQQENLDDVGSESQTNDATGLITPEPSPAPAPTPAPTPALTPAPAPTPAPAQEKKQAEKEVGTNWWEGKDIDLTPIEPVAAQEPQQQQVVQAPQVDPEYLEFLAYKRAQQNVQPTTMTQQAQQPEVDYDAEIKAELLSHGYDEESADLLVRLVRKGTEPHLAKIKALEEQLAKSTQDLSARVEHLTTKEKERLRRQVDEEVLSFYPKAAELFQSKRFSEALDKTLYHPTLGAITRQRLFDAYGAFDAEVLKGAIEVYIRSQPDVSKIAEVGTAIVVNTPSVGATEDEDFDPTEAMKRVREIRLLGRRATPEQVTEREKLLAKLKAYG